MTLEDAEEEREEMKRRIREAIVSRPEELKEFIQTSMVRIVSQSARMQSAKGLVTAGMGRSMTYLVEKMNKKRQGNGQS